MGTYQDNIVVRNFVLRLMQCILCYSLCYVYHVIFMCKNFPILLLYTYIYGELYVTRLHCCSIFYIAFYVFFFFFILFLYSITNVYIYIFLYYSFDRILNFKNRYVIYVFNFDLYSCEYRWRISKIYNKCIISYTSYVPCWFHLTLNGIMVILRSNMKYTYTDTYMWLSNISF